MFDRFSERSRKAMSLARQESQRLHHEYIGAEHILLGLVQEGTGVAAHVLVNLGTDLRRVRAEVERLVRPGKNLVTMGQLPFTPGAKKTLESALAEAQRLGHNYIGTEHLLLGLLADTKGIPAIALAALGVRLERVREEVVEVLRADRDAVREPVKAPPVPPPAPTPNFEAIRALRAADEESARRNHGFVGTEHLLFGVAAGDDDTARVLHECGATVSAVQLEMDVLRGPGDTEVRSEVPQYSVSAARAIGRAWDEAAALGHARVDSRHVALALLAVREGLAAFVLHRLVAAPDALAAKLRALQPRA
jgi:ATP-dependent Clp protease ATP-binding subunit ClpA